MSLDCALEVFQRPEEELYDLRTQSKHYIAHHLVSLREELLPTTAQLMEKCIEYVRDIMSEKVS